MSIKTQIEEYLEEANYVIEQDGCSSDKLKEETFKTIVEDELALGRDIDVSDILNNNREELFY